MGRNTWYRQDGLNAIDIVELSIKCVQIMHIAPEDYAEFLPILYKLDIISRLCVTYLFLKIAKLIHINKNDYPFRKITKVDIQ